MSFNTDESIEPETWAKDNAGESDIGLETWGEGENMGELDMGPEAWGEGKHGGVGHWIKAITRVSMEERGTPHHPYFCGNP